MAGEVRTWAIWAYARRQCRATCGKSLRTGLQKRSGPDDCRGIAELSFFTTDNVFRVNEDVTTADRQRDIADVVDRLGDYRPTHVAVELLASDQTATDA